MIYFIRHRETNRVKIGFSTAPWKRLAKIRSDCSGVVEMVRVSEGGKADEAVLHRRYAHLRSHGEWFRCEGELIDLATAEALVSPKPDSPNKQLVAMGLSKAYASQIVNGVMAPGLPLAVRIYEHTGLKFGLLAKATDEQIGVVQSLMAEAA